MASRTGCPPQARRRSGYRRAARVTSIQLSRSSFARACCSSLPKSRPPRSVRPLRSSPPRAAPAGAGSGIAGRPPGAGEKLPRSPEPPLEGDGLAARFADLRRLSREPAGPRFQRGDRPVTAPAGYCSRATDASRRKRSGSPRTRTAAASSSATRGRVPRGPSRSSSGPHVARPGQSRPTLDADVATALTGARLRPNSTYGARSKGGLARVLPHRPGEAGVSRTVGAVSADRPQRACRLRRPRASFRAREVKRRFARLALKRLLSVAR